jgi:hypothetical protein
MNSQTKPSNDSRIILLCAVITAILMLIATGCFWSGGGSIIGGLLTKLF